MRFIYHHRTAGRGGEGLHITSVVSALRALGHDVMVISPPGVDPMRTADAVPLDKGDVASSGLSRLWKLVTCSFPQFAFELAEVLYNVYATVRLLPVLRRDKGAVYYERYALFLWAGVWLAKALDHRVILEVNEVAGVERARSYAFVTLAQWLERRTFAKADEILTVSSFLQREVLNRGGREGHVHLRPNAIDPKRFGGREQRRDRIRSRLGLTGTTVLGFVGWFDRWDRLDRLVDLLEKLQPTHAAARLLLVGDGPVAAELTAVISREGLEGRIVLSGPVPRDEVPDYIDAMDICILPDSNTFGSPIVLFEFMAMGKAVIAPNVQPVLDVLSDGVTGFIVNRQDNEALLRAVIRLLDGPELTRQIGEAARSTVLARHTWVAVASFVERLAADHVDASVPATMPVAL